MNERHDSSSPVAGQPDVRVHIDRLVVTGIDLRDRAALGEAVRAELTRAFSEQGWSHPPIAGASVDRLSGGTISPVAAHRESGLGAQIAQAVYGGLTR